MELTRFTASDVEILVHTTAPSRGQDDTRYRAITQAYLDFQPASRQRLEIEQRSAIIPPNSQIYISSQSQEELQASTRSERESAASYRPDTQDEAIDPELSPKGNDVESPNPEQFMNSPQLSFESVLDNRDSPWFQHAVTRRGDFSQNFVPLSNIVADSQSENDNYVARKEPDSPTKVLQLYLQNNTESPSHFTIDREQEDMNSPLTQSQPLSSPTTSHPEFLCRVLRSCKRRGNPTRDHGIASKRSKWTEAISDSTPVASTAPLKSLDTDPNLPSSERRGARSQSNESSEPHSSERIGLSNPKSNTSNTPTNPSTTIPSPWSQLDEIRPRPPETGDGSLTIESLITRDLHEIAKRMRLPDLYCPKEQVRPLRPMERGYWLVNYEKWNEGLRSRYWNCLGSFVAKGSLGWGVWCVRDTELQSMRVYCWGAVVGHIYLVLHMASEGKIRGTGPCWIDADVMPIIKMES